MPDLSIEQIEADEKLRAIANQDEWYVEPDDRPGMEWNNHICAGHLTICFMAHSDGKNRDQDEANAQTIAAIVNHAPSYFSAARRAIALEQQCDELLTSLAEAREEIEHLRAERAAKDGE